MIFLSHCHLTMSLTMDRLFNLLDVSNPVKSLIALTLLYVGGCIVLNILLLCERTIFKFSKDDVKQPMRHSETFCCCPFQKSRFFKCMKRKYKKRNAVSPLTSSDVDTACTTATAAHYEWSCPYDTSIVAFVPPLPFHRNRRKNRAAARITTQNPNDNDRTQSSRKAVIGRRLSSSKDIKASFLERPPESSQDQHSNLLSSNNDGQDQRAIAGSIIVTQHCEVSTGATVGSAIHPANVLDATSSTLELANPGRYLMPWTNTAVDFGRSNAYQTSLLDLARMQQWPALIEQCNRRRCKVQDSDGLYPLHWACSGGAPVEAVRALLKAYPRAAHKSSYQGSTALHFACHYGSSSAVVDLLLKTYPTAAKKQDRLGRTPLFHAVYKGSAMDILQLIVDADPTAVQKPLPKSGRTPLYFAWVSVLRDGRRRQNTNASKDKKWNKAVYLLQTAYREISSYHSNRMTQSADDSVKIVPAVIELLPYLPSGTLDLVVQVCPQQLMEPDEITGRLPLSLAASVVDPIQADQVINTLLNVYGEAATHTDKQGKSALSLAVASGKLWDQGVASLLRAAPDTVDWVDDDSALPPVALAAIHIPVPTIPKPEIHQSRIVTEGLEENMLYQFVSKKDYGSNDHGDKIKSVTSTHNRCPLVDQMGKQKECLDSKNLESSTIGTIYELLRCNPAVLKSA
jgi:ankyrin repeat protein